MNLPKTGRVRFRWTKDLPGVTRSSPPGRITGARLVKDALGWHIVFRTELHVPVPAPHRGPAVGMDRGIAVPLALSTGDHLTHGPWLTGGEQARLLRLQRASARRRAHRTKGGPVSNRERRTYDQIAELRAKAKRRALDWQHKTTTTLAETFSVIVVEDLLLTYKTADRGGLVAKVPPRGTSRECHRCHTTVPGSRESQARFVCKNPACGWIGNADTNAARNQLHRYTTAAGRAVTGRGGSEVSGSVKRQASCPTVSPAPAPRAAA
ncbi:transposase [Nonomuraea wenchangensis]